MAKRNAKEWRNKMRERQASATEEITLPSGMVVDAKRPPLAEWIKRGQLPAGVMKLALDAFGDGKAGASDPMEAQKMMQAMQRGDMKIDPALVQGMKPDDFKELMDFMGHVVQQTVISPRIVIQVDGMGEVQPDQAGQMQYMKARGVPTGEYVVKGDAGWQITFANGAQGVLPVVRPLNEDEEIDAAEIDDPDTTFIFNYAMTGMLTDKVEMAGGEVTAAEAGTFHPNDTLPAGGKGQPLLEGEAVEHFGG